MGVTAAIGSVVANAYNANQQKQQMKGANYRAEQAALKQEKQLEQQMNAANKKKPNTNALLSNAAQNARAGQSGTMLTGSQGIDPAALTLGKTTLLGG
jgi:hypothetical protein